MKKVIILFILIIIQSPAFSQKIDMKAVEDKAFLILEKGSRSGDMEARALSLLGMVMLKGKNILPLITDALKDPQWIVRRSAIIALIKLRNNKYVEELKSALRDPSVPLHSDAFEILSNLSDKDTIKFFMEPVLEKASQTRLALLQSAINKGGEILLEVIRQCYSSSRQDVIEDLQKLLPSVSKTDREKVCELLTGLKSVEAIRFGLELIEKWEIKPPLKNLKNLIKLKEKDISLKSAEILALSGDSSALNYLKPLLNSKKMQEQQRFLNAAKYSATKDLIPEIRKFLHPDTPADILQLVYDIYAHVGDETIQQKVEEELKSTILARRVAATATIGHIIGKRALPILHNLLFDGNKEVRLSSAKALGELQQVESVKFLQRALSGDPDADVRYEIVLSLGKIYDQSVIEVLKPFAYDFDERIRKGAISGICNIHHDSALPLLRLFIDDREIEIRLCVLKAIIGLSPVEGLKIFENAIGWFPPEELPELTKNFGSLFLPFLEKCIKSGREELRQGALVSLRELPKDEEKILIEQFNNSAFFDVRKYCLERLEEIKNKDVLPFVEIALKDKSSEVKISGLKILSEYADHSFIQKLGEILLDLDERVRVEGSITMLKIATKKVKKR